MSSANQGNEVGAGLEDLLPPDSLGETSSWSFGRFGLGWNEWDLRRPSWDVVEVDDEASGCSVFLSAFQLLPAPLALAGLAVAAGYWRFMRKKWAMLVRSGFEGGAC